MNLQTLKKDAFHILLPIVWLSIYFGKVAQIVTLLLFVIMLMAQGKKQNTTIFRKEDVFVYLFFGAISIVSINAIQPLISFRYVAVLGALFLTYRLMASCHIKLEPNKFLKYLQYLAVGISIIWGLEIIDIINFGDLLHFKRKAGAFHKALSFYAPVMGMLVPLLLHKFCISKSKKDLLALFVVMFMIVLSNGRSGVAAALIGGGVYLLFCRNIQRKIKLQILAVLALLVFAGYTIYLYKYGLHRINVVSGKFSTIRTDIWQYGIEQFLENKWLGIGLQNYRYLPDTYLAGFMHPHNIIVQFLLETGMIGTVTLMLAIGKALCVVYKKNYDAWINSSTNSYNFTLAILASILGFCAASLVFTSIFHAWWLVYILLLVIILQSFCKEKLA